VPDKVTRVATVGPVPVINSFVFALGEAGSIVNGLPSNLGGSGWSVQYLAAPGLEKRPVLQGGQGDPSVEMILALAPDVVLSMDLRTVKALESVGIPVLYLSWRQPDDIKSVIRLLGNLYGKSDAAESYCRYFDATLARVAARTASQPESQRPRVLFANLPRLTQPHLIAEWWIAMAGGRSVTSDDRTAESLTFSLEQLLAWNPEIIIVGTPSEIAYAYAEPRFADLKAVRDKRIYAIPRGAHVWGNRTVEQPLTVLWAAKIIHPELFADLVLEREISTFYADFFRISPDPKTVEKILAGRVDP